MPRKIHQCHCGRTYSRSDSLSRHQKYECGVNAQFECPFCYIKMKQRFNMQRHIRSAHKDKTEATLNHDDYSCSEFLLINAQKSEEVLLGEPV